MCLDIEEEKNIDRGTTRKAAAACSESADHSNAHGAEVLTVEANDQCGSEGVKAIEDKDGATDFRSSATCEGLFSIRAYGKFVITSLDGA